MDRIEDLYELALELNDGNPHNPNDNFENVGDVVEALVALGNSDAVFPYYDEHLGLIRQLSEAFLDTPLEELEEHGFEYEVRLVLAQANKIIALSRRDISDDDLEEIDNI